MLKACFFFALIVVCVGYKDGLLNSELYKKYLRLRSLPYEDCGSEYSIVYLNLSSCSTIPCEMVRGSNVLVQTIFNDNGNNIQLLKHSVRWIFNAIKTGATISPDPCNGQDECISNESEGKSYWAWVHVNNSLPVMRGTMLWEAADENNKMVICFKIPVIITLET